MARDSFSSRVIAAAKRWYPYKPFRAADLIEPLQVKDRKEAKKISVALGDHYKAGRLVRLTPGLYRFPMYGEKISGDDKQPTSPAAPLIKDKMWSILRSRGTVTVADLQELTGAAADYAKEFLQMLAKQEIVKARPQPGNQPWKYQLVKRDLVAAPTDNQKADRLQAQRKKKLARALDQLDKSIKLIRTLALEA